MNDEFGRMWEEVVSAHFKVIFHHLPEVTEESHKKSQSL
jgi:hypothetical protein